MDNEAQRAQIRAEPLYARLDVATQGRDVYLNYETDHLSEAASVQTVLSLPFLLAAALGADLDAPGVVEDRSRFDAAATTLREATAAKPGLTAMFASGSTDTLYVADPRADSPVWVDDELGLDVVMPDVPVADHWDALSLDPPQYLGSWSCRDKGSAL